MTILVCECGRRLKAAGAAPGRVGKCPACGSLLRVADDAPTLPPPRSDAEDEAAGYALTPGAEARSATFVAPRSKIRAPEKARELTEPPKHGLVRMPKDAETRWRDSLLYPLWDAPGVGFLGFLPGFLWITSLLSFGLIPNYVLGDQPEFVMMAALLMVFAMLCVFALLMGRALSYLEHVLLSSAQGDVMHPRLPAWDVFGLVGVWGRVVWAALAGGGPVAFLAILYWISCGDIDWADAAILGTLATLGTASALMAFVAVVLHNDLMAANLVTVLVGLRRVGWGYLKVCLPAVAFVTLNGLAVAVLFRLPGFVLPVLATAAFWPLFLYQAMALGRIVGLFYHRNSKALGWFPERPRWGR